MRQGKLEEVTHAQHRIDLTPGSRPVLSKSYRAVTQSIKVIYQNIGEMKAQGVNESNASEWASTVFPAPKAEGYLRFCI